MKPEELKEYLGIVVDMEKNIFMQGQTKSQWEREIAGLGKPHEFQEPFRPEETPLPRMSETPAPPPPTKPEQPKIVRYPNRAFWITLTVDAIYYATYLPHGIELLAAAPLACVIMGIIVAAITAVIVFFFGDDMGTLKKYSNQKREYTAASKETLKQIYDKNIISPKYRNMVMVCSLYEYVCTGRCDTLEGHEGAYNLLELEIRLDKIVTQLDRVVEMLGRIQQSQYMVYSAIQDANQQSAKILESTYQMTDQLQAFQASNWKMLGGIQAGMQRGILAAEQQSVTMAQMTQQLSALQATSALTAYQTERTRTELHYMNRMNYLSGKNDEVFFNLPPM